MRNEIKTAVELRRIDICDLMIACTTVQRLSNDGGEKWKRLHDKLKENLDFLDKQLDEFEMIFENVYVKR